MKSTKNLMNLKGRIALITGAAGKLGMLFSETLFNLGASLILVDKREFKPNLVTSKKQSVISYKSDLENHAEREKLIEDIKLNHRSINILINNAAFVGSSNLDNWNSGFESQSIESFRSAIEVNLTAAFHLTRDLTPLLKNSEGATIINIGSIYGLYGPDWRIYHGTSLGNPAAYGISKAGLFQFTKWLATTLAPNIRVNAISPGGISRNQHEDFVSAYVSRTPLGRMATEEDFRGTITYLATDMSEYLTGQIIQVDGGWGVW